MDKKMFKKVNNFLWEQPKGSIGFKGNCKRGVQYRYEHSNRVATIGWRIAGKEGFDEEKMAAACLLHDIGYAVECENKEDNKNHGRIGAEIARSFLKECGYSAEDVHEMCCGIACHVDDRCDFKTHPSVFAGTIGDADNINRFDAYRLYEWLHFADYMNLPIEKQSEFVVRQLQKLKKLKEFHCATATAEKMWQQRLNYQIHFYRKLQKRIGNGNLCNR